MPLPKTDSNILKIAVELIDAPDKLAQFVTVDQRQPLSSLIQMLCKNWRLPDPANYALQYSVSDNQNNIYVTEKNRSEIKNGSVLRLEQSPAKIAENILAKINTGIEAEQMAVLTKLSILSSDITFALEFINREGLSLIIHNIETGKLKENCLIYVFVSFVKLMDHGVISWNILENQFINQGISFVSNQTNTPKMTQSYMSILENIVLSSVGKNTHVEKEIFVPFLTLHLETQDIDIQQNAIALINAILLKADINKRQNIAAILYSKQVRNKIYENIITINIPKEELGTELAHQLYVLQTVILGLLKPKMQQPANFEEQQSEQQEQMEEVKNYECDNDNNTNNKTSRPQSESLADDFKNLEFKNQIDSNNLFMFTIRCRNKKVYKYFSYVRGGGFPIPLTTLCSSQRAAPPSYIVTYH